MTAPAETGDDAPSVIGAVMRLARQAPRRVALVDRGVPVAYGDLGLRIRRCAAWLLAEGFHPGDTIGLTLREEAAHCVATLALLRLGCRQVTLASHDPPAMRAALAARLGVVAVLADGAADGLADAGLLTLPDGAFAAGDDAPEPPPAAPGSLVVTSSGTTGRPKLVELPDAALALQGAMTVALGRIRHRAVGNQFATAKRLQLHTLAGGGTEVLANNAALGSMAETCARFGVERVNLSPLKAEALLAEAARPGAPPWPAGTGITLAGGPVPAALRRRLAEALTPDVHVLYGTSECGPVCIAGPADHALDPATVGPPAAGVTVEAVDEDGRALPPGERGYLRIRSPAAATGYLDDAEATARAFRDGWFLPGDVGHVTPCGAVVLAGRADDMMNLGTMKIFPSEIEQAAAGFPGLRDCAAFALPARALGDIPVLAAEAADGFDAAALHVHLRGRLGLRAPRRVLPVATLPRNASGKVVRRDLVALLQERGE